MRDSELRYGGGTYCPPYDVALIAIYNAVKGTSGLAYGKLHPAPGESCAIGSYFDCNPKTALPTNVIDEIATINDSVGPSRSARVRRKVVLAYLENKLRKRGLLPKAS